MRKSPSNSKRKTINDEAKYEENLIKSYISYKMSHFNLEYGNFHPYKQMLI